MSDTVECPYCGYICPDVEYSEQPEGCPIEFECGNCEKLFLYQYSISIFFTTSIAECLNDGNHQWIQNNRWYPKKIGWVQCKICGREEENKELWQILEQKKEGKTCT